MTILELHSRHGVLYLEYRYFTNVIFTTLYTSSALIFIHHRYKNLLLKNISRYMKNYVVNNIFCEFIFFKRCTRYVNESLMGVWRLSIGLYVPYKNVLNGRRRNFVFAIYAKRLILIRITQTEILLYMELKSFYYDGYFSKLG
jgi:hypothetical protein